MPAHVTFALNRVTNFRDTLNTLPVMQHLFNNRNHFVALFVQALRRAFQSAAAAGSHFVIALPHATLRLAIEDLFLKKQTLTTGVTIALANFELLVLVAATSPRVSNHLLIAATAFHKRLDDNNAQLAALLVTDPSNALLTAVNAHLLPANPNPATMSVH